MNGLNNLSCTTCTAHSNCNIKFGTLWTNVGFSAVQYLLFLEFKIHWHESKLYC